MPLVSIIGCASAAQRTTPPPADGRVSAAERAEGKAVTNAAAQEAKAHDFVEIEFVAGSATLTENAKTSLNAVLQQAQQSGKIDEVLVLSWSDEEYPSKGLKKQSPAQIDLAEKRNKAIKEYMKTVRSVSVDTYNMAKQPNALSRWFNTSDNRLKNSMTAAGLPTSADSQQYPSKASHSVILVKIE